MVIVVKSFMVVLYIMDVLMSASAGMLDVGMMTPSFWKFEYQDDIEGRGAYVDSFFVCLLAFYHVSKLTSSFPSFSFPFLKNVVLQKELPIIIDTAPPLRLLVV